MIETIVALAGCLGYGVVSMLVGDRFPFSRYSMYAKLRDRREGAVLFVRTGERFIEPQDVDQVFGIDVSAIDPKPVPCSQQWLVYEAQRWFSSRMVERAPENAAPLEVGWRILSLGEDGRVVERLRVVTRGVGTLFR